MPGYMSRRKKVSLKSQKVISIARAHGFIKKAMDEFFAPFREALSKHQFEAIAVDNLNES